MDGPYWRTALSDAAAVVLAWGALLLAENVALGFLWRDQFSAPWEIALARHTVVPIAFAGLAPLSLVVVAGWRVAARAAAGERPAVRVLAATGAVVAGAIATGITGGRHFASWTVRAPFEVAMAAVGAVCGVFLAPRVAHLARRPVALAALGLIVTIVAWLGDAYVLPRLYPAFHAALLAATLLGAALVGLAFRAGSPPGRIALAIEGLVFVAVVSCAAATPHAVRSLDRATNLRLALVEHAPLLGRTVVAAVRLHPRPAEQVPGLGAAPGTPVEPGRSLDWTGHDLVLLTVDALRADHVSGYGYARPTTPNLDRLAREGVVFESAYCPTPHTSYSVTSMMTGKYMRPLLTLGLGEESETWPQALRRYGWRTAAFYPPAVFFIDEERFGHFEKEHLGFEYAKVEFADPELRERQVAEYLDSAPAHVPVFLWVHFFEPHEPYVVHPEHVFEGGDALDVNAYDSEVASADDGIGAILRVVRTRRPGAIVIVTADHGEEFGEHGGRYHGTSVYEEQVRVPLVMVGPGIRPGGRVHTVVQTIDLLPTTLSALGMPRPARLRGRDLGPILAIDPTGPEGQNDKGFAFAETDDYALVAGGDERLVCERRAAACVLYRPREDPLERHDVAVDHPDRFDTLRALLRAVERDHGRYEAIPGAPWPEALRRGIQGEADAVLDVASLLDDADVTIRRKAAEVCFRLHVPTTVPALRRALAGDEDTEVQGWSALALARTGEPLAPLAESLLRSPSRDWRRRAALALGERGDRRACDEISAWWASVLPPQERAADGEPSRLTLDLAEAEELLMATGKARCKTAVPALVRALDDVRARPYVADALGAIGDERARGPLLDRFATEPYVTARPHEARALLSLGVRDWGAPSATAAQEMKVRLAAPMRAAGYRLLVLLSDATASLEAVADGVALETGAPGTEVRAVELLAPREGRFELDVRASMGGLVAAWLVPAHRPD
jgi:arylsulfatase A-like enzyme